MVREMILLLTTILVVTSPFHVSGSPVDGVAIQTDDEILVGPDPTPTGIRNFLGIGYDIIDGNPEGGDLFKGGVDPGLLISRPVFQLTYDDQIVSQDNYLLPDQVSYNVRASCVQTQETFYGTKSYAEKVESDVEESHNAQGRFNIVKFSGSNRYADVQASIEINGNVYYEDHEVCNHANARYRLELVESEAWPLDSGFVAEACKLPEYYDEITYMIFLDTWGTHVVDEVALGTKSTTRYEETTHGFVQYANTHVANSVSFQANIIPGYEGGVVVDMSTFKAGLNVGMSFGSETNTFTSGSEEYQEPIGLHLIGMHEIFDPLNGYWQRFEDYVNDGRCGADWINGYAANAIKTNMEQALDGYAAWKNAQESQDPLVGIPITWPKGQYGLPMPLVGCPNSHFDWSEGNTYQDTESVNPDNHWSNPCHLAGPYWQNNMNSKYCMKTTAEEDIFAWPFQSGLYCVFKKGSCPAGLSEGWIYWDDDDPNSSNDNHHEGELPDGTYDVNTKIYYCCRTDGYATNAIYLPTDEPFYLMKYNHQCQEVYGMKVTEEYFHWDTSDAFNDDDDGGTHPYQGVEDKRNVRIEYCYYEADA